MGSNHLHPYDLSLSGLVFDTQQQRGSGITPAHNRGAASIRQLERLLSYGYVCVELALKRARSVRTSDEAVPHHA